jgi:hypothetical protein
MIRGLRGVALAGGLALTLAAGMAARPAPHARSWWQDPAAIRRGAHDVATGSCISCHPLAGVSNAGEAIDLSHEGSRRSLPWLLHELAHPTSQRPPIPPGQLRDIAAYLKSLR